MPETVKQAVDSLSADLDNEVDGWYWFDRGEDGDEDPIPMYSQEKLLKLRTSLQTHSRGDLEQEGLQALRLHLERPRLLYMPLTSI